MSDALPSMPMRIHSMLERLPEVSAGVRDQSKVYIGIDNGVSGSIAILTSNGELLGWSRTPTYKRLSYAKTGRLESCIDRVHLKYLLQPYKDGPALVLMEYPYLNPTQFATSFSATTSFADTRSVVEDLGMAHDFKPAKEWQKVMIPNVKGTIDLKQASTSLAKRLYPKLVIPKGCDGDAVCLAEYGRRKGL